MATFPRPLFSSLLLATFFNVAAAQQQRVIQGSPSARTVVLFSFPPAGQQYQLRRGDRILLRVLGHPEFSSDLNIDERGMINLPRAGEVAAAGRTIRELRAEIVTRYRTYEKHPHVYVALAEMRSEPVRVYAEHDATGRETVISTGWMNLDGMRMVLRISYSAKDGVVFWFSPVEDQGTYELTAVLNSAERVVLSSTIKQNQRVDSIHGSYFALSMKVSLKSLAMIANVREIKMRLRDKEFELKEEHLEALRFMVQHITASSAPSRTN